MLSMGEYEADGSTNAWVLLEQEEADGQAEVRGGGGGDGGRG